MSNGNFYCKTRWKRVPFSIEKIRNCQSISVGSTFAAEEDFIVLLSTSHF